MINPQGYIHLKSNVSAAPNFLKPSPQTLPPSSVNPRAVKKQKHNRDNRKIAVCNGGRTFTASVRFLLPRKVALLSRGESLAGLEEWCPLLALVAESRSAPDVWCTVAAARVPPMRNFYLRTLTPNFPRIGDFATEVCVRSLCDFGFGIFRAAGLRFALRCCFKIPKKRAFAFCISIGRFRFKLPLLLIMSSTLLMVSRRLCNVKSDLCRLRKCSCVWVYSSDIFNFFVLFITLEWTLRNGIHKTGPFLWWIGVCTFCLKALRRSRWKAESKSVRKSLILRDFTSRSHPFVRTLIP